MGSRSQKGNFIMSIEISQQGACVNNSDFHQYPDRDKPWELKDSIAICSQCPIEPLCLLETTTKGNKSLEDGIMGGTERKQRRTEEQRKALLVEALVAIVSDDIQSFQQVRN